LCLLNEALDLRDYPLLLFRQLAIGNRSETALCAGQALVNGGVVLALLLGRQNVAETGRWIGLGRSIGPPWRILGRLR
jgi:hypothetical protein